MAEWTENFVLNHAHAASHGLSYLQHPYQHHGPGFLGERSRIFSIPPGVVRLPGEIHPFSLLESSRILAVNGFLALRRAQELTWVPKV